MRRVEASDRSVVAEPSDEMFTISTDARGTPARTLTRDEESTRTASNLPEYSTGEN